jgi:IS1 family transposase
LKPSFKLGMPTAIKRRMPSSLFLCVLGVFALINQPSFAAPVGIHHFRSVCYFPVEHINIINHSAKDSRGVPVMVALLHVLPNVKFKNWEIALAGSHDFVRRSTFNIQFAKWSGRQFFNGARIRFIRNAASFNCSQCLSVVRQNKGIVSPLALVRGVHADINKCSLCVYDRLGIAESRRGRPAGSIHGLLKETSLTPEMYQGLTSITSANGSNRNQDGRKENINASEDYGNAIPPIFRYRHGGKFGDEYGFMCVCLGWGGAWFLIVYGCVRLLIGRRRVFGFTLLGCGIVLDVIATMSGAIGCLPWDWWGCLHDGQRHSQNQHFHGIIVTQKLLTTHNYCITLIDMANVLNTDKQIAVISALAEGSSIRSIERITGVHRDTIMRLGVKVGKGCQSLMDAKMRDLPCHYLEFDEIWGFIGKKEKHCTVDDSPELGDVWTFCAVDAETKIVPTFRCGKRDRATANAFVQDVASRMKNRVQISTDGLRSYVEAIEKSFGAEVDYAQIVKTYTHDVEINPNHRYSAPEIVTTEKKIFTGSPEIDRISTSYVERLNGTTRTHMRRLTRLTLAFSKKLENFEAAVGLHFAYYNFVRRHNTLRCTPAMAAGIESSFLSVGDLIEAAA